MRTKAFCGAAWRRPGVQVVEEEEGLECERSEVQSGNPEQPTCQHVPPNNNGKTTQIAALNEWVTGPE